MAHDILPGDLLEQGEHGFVIHRQRGQYISHLPVTFSGLPDYFSWLERNASQLCPNDAAKFAGAARELRDIYIARHGGTK